MTPAFWKRTEVIRCEVIGCSLGDRLLVTGPTTGVMYLTATEIHDNDGHPVSQAPQGQRIAIPVTAKVQPSDKLFKLERS